MLQNVVLAQVQTRDTGSDSCATFEAEFNNLVNFEELRNVSKDSCSMAAKENLYNDESRLKNESIVPQTILEAGNMQIDEPQHELSSDTNETPYVQKNNARVDVSQALDTRDDLDTSKQEDVSDWHPFFKKTKLGGMFDRYPLVSIIDIFN